MKVISKFPHPHDNKENIKFNRKPEQSFRHRNDHSIQAKSPLKIPQSNLKRQDLTFRQNTCHSPNRQLRVEEQKFSYTAESLGISVQNQKSQLNVCPKLNLAMIKKSGASSQSVECNISNQCQIVDRMWDLCNSLTSINNSQLKDSIQRIKAELANMMTIVAHQNFNNEDPLASSKKTKLQNCIAISHCEKEVHHKQFESEHLEEYDELSKRAEEALKSSQRTIKSQKLQQSQKSNQSSNQTPKLEMRKIIYMLQGKQNKNSSTSAMNSFSSDRKRSGRLSSLSSFNQNECDESGFTVFEIEKCTEREASSKREWQIRKLYENEHKNSEEKLKMSQSSGNEYCQSLCEAQSVETSCVGNKRKVLNDIVAMLNQKYNKNIRLQ